MIHTTLYHQLQQIYVLLDDGDRRALQPLNLTPTQYNLLVCLNGSGENGRTITDLAHQLLCTRGNITRLVQRLEEQGLVQTGSDPADQRLVRVTLTATGLEKRQAAQSAHAAAIQRRFETLPATSQQQLADLTQQLTQILTADLAQNR